MDCIVVSEERLASLSEFLNTKVTAESTNKYYEAELVHGRAAMLAFSAVVTQSALGNTAFPYF